LDPPDDVDHLVDLYNSTLRDIVDEHASLRTREMPRRQMLPWYNKNIQDAKRNRRYCERLWIRASLCVNYEMFKAIKSQIKNTLASTKSEEKKRSKHPKEIKGLYSVLWINYYIKVKLSFQIISTQIKISPIVLITS